MALEEKLEIFFYYWLAKINVMRNPAEILPCLTLKSLKSSPPNSKENQFGFHIF
jgi:hypothetical protein